MCFRTSSARPMKNSISASSVRRSLVAPRADRLGEFEPPLDEWSRLGVAIAERQQRALGFQREHLGEAIA